MIPWIRLVGPLRQPAVANVEAKIVIQPVLFRKVSIRWELFR